MKHTRTRLFVAAALAALSFGAAQAQDKPVMLKLASMRSTQRCKRGLTV